MKRFTLSLCLGLIALPGVALAAGSSTSTKSEIAQIEQTTVRMRGLKPLHSVAVKIQSNGAFDASFKALLQAGITDPEIEMNRRELVLLGLLKPTDNLRSLLLNSSAVQVVGFYDYHAKALYLRNDSNRLLGPERYNIAHEYTHALQDQHFHLAKLLPDQWPLAYRNSDAVAAHHALTEGDAVNLQTLYINRTYSPQDLQALLKLSSQPDTSPPLPTVLKRQLYFPYTTGVDFVDGLYKSGGMSAIDQAYKRLPSSTFEIMHPAAYLAHWKSAMLPIHGVQGFSDWQQVDDDVWGAFGYNLLIWQFLGHKTADSVTNGYRGDRYLFLEKGDANAMLFKSVWRNPKSARTATSQLVGLLKHRFPNARVTGPAIAKLVTSPNVSVAFRLAGSKLTMAYAPSSDLAQKLVSAPTN